MLQRTLMYIIIIIIIIIAIIIIVIAELRCTHYNNFFLETCLVFKLN